MCELPEWLATEDAVKRLFSLYGFEVDSMSIGGRQIDLVASRRDTFGFDPEQWAVEITTERVDVNKGSKDYQKLQLARKQNPSRRLMLISTAGFTPDQKASLTALGVIAKEYYEFEAAQVDLHRYAVSKLRELETQKAPDIGYSPTNYIEPELTIQSGEAKKTTEPAGTWVRNLVGTPAPCLCALLGNLGSGKTSLLDHILERGCKAFLDQPSTAPVPLYVPLGRYKQHSGDIEQMLMSEFRQIGQETYPAGVVRHLIDTRRIILLLDGLDEIHPIQNSEDVLDTVTRIIGGVGGKAAAVLTCRRHFLESTRAELAYFGPYTSSHLEDVQAGLARKLRGHPTTYIVTINPFDRPRIEQYLEKRCGMTPDRVAELFAQFYGFEDMAQTPVLLAMIATTAEERLINPGADGCSPLLALYEAYTNRWLERDVGRARLSKEQRRRLSHILAEQMFWQARESETWSHLREVLKQSPDWKNNPLTDEEAELDIRNSGFLVRDLDDRYRFVHRSIMEFFAAKSEVQLLKSGARPRHFPTDGFRTFFAYQMAKDWAEGAGPAFPPESWEINRGESVIEAQLSMLAAASKHIPPGKKLVLSRVYCARTTCDQSWQRVQFENVSWEHRGGSLAFVECSFNDSKLFVKGDVAISFRGCGFKRTEISWEKFPSSLSSGGAEPDAQGAALQLPPAVWLLADLAQQGVVIRVGGVGWGIHREHLDLFAESAHRLRGKTMKQNYLRGTRRTQLTRLLPILKRLGLVREDASRQGHQLELTSQAFALIGRLQKEPMAAQEEFIGLFARHDQDSTPDRPKRGNQKKRAPATKPRRAKASRARK
jgi:hypothetical protein